VLSAAGDPPGRQSDGKRAADGAGGLQLLEHRRGGRAPWPAPAAASAVPGGLDDQQVLDAAAAWTVARLDDGAAVLVVDETADEKSSADAVGAARQYSGTVGGIALCQVAAPGPLVRAAACWIGKRGLRARGRPFREACPSSRPGPAAWSDGQDPGAVSAGQAAAEQVAQVHRGDAALQPGVVPGLSA
jgi:hypothetical protein